MSGTLEQEYHDRPQTCVDVFLDHMQREEAALETSWCVAIIGRSELRNVWIYR